MTLRLNIVSFEEGNDGKKYSTVVGAAFEHSDKNGFDLVIRAFPLNGEFAILLPKDVDDEMPQREEMHCNALIQETVRSGREEDPKYKAVKKATEKHLEKERKKREEKEKKAKEEKK